VSPTAHFIVRCVVKSSPKHNRHIALIQCLLDPGFSRHPTLSRLSYGPPSTRRNSRQRSLAQAALHRACVFARLNRTDERPTPPKFGIPVKYNQDENLPRIPGEESVEEVAEAGAECTEYKH
jgi:hypothetical protein